MSEKKPIKTRFAPSPTGYLHVGGLRTALYCYLFAHKNKGKFVLRIEDTDQERYVEGAKENLIDTLNWIGLDYDEGPLKDGTEKGNFGPYIQSKRSEIYKEYADKLLKTGHAYQCFCTKERLEQLRETQIKNKQATMYDKCCMDLPESEIEQKLKEKTPYVIRQKIPFETIKFKDIIRGNMQFDGKLIDDQVLMKSDGFPTYHLANVVDDHLMEITHVIRGEEWLPSTPKHILLYKAFGWDPPQFAHLPLLLNADKTKLSKRQGHVSVEEYINEGYIKESIINFVTFLGWNPGKGEEREIYTLKELEQIFELETVHKAGAIFNIEKLDWFNWKWQKAIFEKKVKKSPELRAQLLLEKCEKYLNPAYSKDKKTLLKILPSVEEKILKNPKEINEHIDFYFELPNYNKDLLTHEKMNVSLDIAKKALEKSLQDLEKSEDWTQEKITETLMETIKTLEFKNGQVLWPIRVALTGKQFSSGAFEVAFALGKDETLSRIKDAIKKL
jgi:glutamyl-tRNA synthetase